jgi:hypothetical protein
VLDRIENSNTGEILPDFLKVPISPKVQKAAEVAAQVLGDTVWKEVEDFIFRFIMSKKKKKKKKFSFC